MPDIAPRFPLLLLVATAACSREPASTPGTQVRDSAGVRIVVSERPRWTPAARWSVAGEPELVIGREEGEDPYLFSRVGGARRLPDGRIVVANGGTSEIRFYDSAGVFLGATGRRGQGPGEYQVLQRIWTAPGDSLVAFDGGAFRVTVLDVAGAFGRSAVLAPAGDRGLPSPFGSTRSGDLLVTSGSGGFRAGEVGRLEGGTIRVTRYGPDGRFLNDIVAYPGSPRWGYRNTAHYFPFAVGWLVFGWDRDHVYSGTGHEPEVRVSAPDGTVTELLRWSANVRPVTDEVVARYREDLLTDATQQERSYWEGWLAEVPFPDALPVYRTLLADAAGDLWVEHYRTDWETQPVWSVFDPGGAWLGDVSTPERFRITEIGNDYVLGVHRDGMEVEQVRLYPLVKPS